MRSIVRNILAAGSLLLGLHTTAQASPILVVQNGILMGAQAVEFDGRLYDVAFSDARPAAANFVFDTFEETYGASDALDRLVFQGVYDTSPGRTNGCTNPISCLVVTAYDISWLGVGGAAFTNTATRYLDLTVPYVVAGNAASQAGVTYAHWTLNQPRQAVPEPSSLLLAGIGLAALLGSRRRRAASRA